MRQSDKADAARFSDEQYVPQESMRHATVLLYINGSDGSTFGLRIDILQMKHIDRIYKRARHLIEHAPVSIVDASTTDDRKCLERRIQ